MAKKEALLLIGLRVHGYQAAAGGEEDDVFVGHLGPLEIDALLRRVADDVLQLHDWITVELRVDLPGLSNEHPRLVWSRRDVTVRAWHAVSSHARTLNPLPAQPTSCFVAKAEHFVR